MRFEPRKIEEVASELGLGGDHVELYGRAKAKVDLSALSAPSSAPSSGKGRLILVSAINPTPAGEGKTTTSVALGMSMRRLGKRAVLALRQPSLGPVFGVKGGATGGGKAQLHPADEINLHFTGDLHAITSAHNLLSALIDNALYFREAYGDKGELDPRQIGWGRALDMNDRALRRCLVGLGGKTNGVPREERFDITAASEIMAITALANDYADLEARISRIVVGMTYSGKAITAGDLGAAGAMTALLRDALKPNLVQTAEGGAAFVHCGPFGNIAHGCNSVLATRMAMRFGDYAITEAGFGFDLGGEKFLDIKCRQLGAWPRVVVLVTTLRALKMHGGAPVKNASQADAGALSRGLEHLGKHIENIQAFGLAPVVALNVFPEDTESELKTVEEYAAKHDVRAGRSEGFSKGGEGAMGLAQVVCDAADATDARPPEPRFTYSLTDPPAEKMRKVARAVYGANDVQFAHSAEADIQRIADLGYAELPVCMAKTQLSLSDNPVAVGRPRNFDITVREVRLSAGAGFMVAVTGQIMTMPGLPKQPAARHIRLIENGRIKGLMQND